MEGSHPHFITRLRISRDLQYRTETLEPGPDVYLLSPNHFTRRRTVVGTEASEYDAFCSCWKDRASECTCGETGKVLEWVWDVDTKSNCTHLVNNSKDVRFHLHFSGGTACIRGSRPITNNQHYWEVKMTTLVYGTDMMVGIGTKDADSQKLSDKFCSVLGIDSETWGLSYTGMFYHQGVAKPFTSGFGQGSIIGVHLDMWNGTLSFYKNRQPLGVACTGLKGKTLYPMVSSTAARSGMRVIHSISFPSSLQFLCCVALRKAVSINRSVFDAIPMPPGMQLFLSNNLGWLLGDCHLERSFIPDEIIQRYTRFCSTPLESSQAHLYKDLTCEDCNTPVFSSTNKAAEDVFQHVMPSHLLQVGPVILQRCRVQNSSSDQPRLQLSNHGSSQSTSRNSEQRKDSDDETAGEGGSESNKRQKVSHGYINHFSDYDDSD